MRRRISVVAVAIAAASLVFEVGLATAASTAAKPTVLKCKITMATQPPAGTNIVDQPATRGMQYGPSHCSTTGFGGGVIANSFKVPDSGDTVGTFVQYLHAGTIRAKFDMAPLPSTGISENGFESQSWQGTLTVLSGTGVYSGIKSKKNVGKLKCTSPDSVHLTCHEKVKVVP